MHYLARSSGGNVHPEVDKAMPDSQLNEYNYYMRLVNFLTLVVEIQSYYELERARAMAYQQTVVHLVRMKSGSESSQSLDGDQSTYEQKLLAAHAVVEAANAMREHFELQKAYDKAAEALGVANKTNSPVARNLDETRWFLKMLHGYVSDKNRSQPPFERYHQRATGSTWLTVLRKRYRINLV